MGALIPLALSIAPELAKWLCGDDAEKTAATVSEAIQAAAGTADAEAAAARLQQDSVAASQLRLRLAQIATERENASRAAELENFATSLRDTAKGSSQATAVTTQASMAWSAPVVSTVVLLTFGAVMGMVLLRGMPAGAETAVNMLLGTLAAMATSVVSYWVGSSAGSARKDDRLAQSGR